MKKKLVAFAVTAAMVITSAVPALAWGPNTDTTDYTKNQLVVDKDVNEGAGIVADNLNGEITDGKTFTATVDLNRTNADFEFVLGLNTAGRNKKDVKLAYQKTSEKFLLMTGEGETWDKGEEASGLVDITWTFTKNDKGTWLNVDIQERAKTASQGGINFEWQLPVAPNAEVTDLTSVYSLKLAKYEGANLPSGTFTGKEQVVIYQDPAAAPTKVVSVEVAEAVKKAGKWEVATKYGKPIIATQPVAGKTYIVNSITLDDGTVIDGADVDEYVTYEWQAVKANGVTVPTLMSGKGNNTNNVFKVSANGTFNGCFIKLVVSADKTSGIFGSATWGADAEALAVQSRIAGENRYETALKVADQMKTTKGFTTFFVATGTNYADALSATALANEKNAPILLVNSKTGAYEKEVAEYIEANAASYKTTKVYVLGGYNAVSKDFEEMLYKLDVDVERLAGNNRYDTNLKILDEYAAVPEGDNWSIQDEAGKTVYDRMKTVLVATGNDYADALSASATGYPVLLVDDVLKASQREFLRDELTIEVGGKTYYAVTNYAVLGGTNAVSANVKNELAGRSYTADAAKVVRYAGDDRYETNRAIVNKLMGSKDSFDYAFVATGNDYADALTGGVLAAKTGCPILLVNDTHYEIAKKLVKSIKSADTDASFGGLVVVGGENAVSNELVQKIA